MTALPRREQYRLDVGCWPTGLDDLQELERKLYPLGMEDLAATLGVACDLIEEAQGETRELQRLIDDRVLLLPADMTKAQDKLAELVRLLDTDDDDAPDLVRALKLAIEAQAALDV